MYLAIYIYTHIKKKKMVMNKVYSVQNVISNERELSIGCYIPIHLSLMVSSQQTNNLWSFF